MRDEIHDGQRAHNLAHKPYYSPIKTLTLLQFHVLNIRHNFSFSITHTSKRFVEKDEETSLEYFSIFTFLCLLRYLTLSQCIINKNLDKLNQG